MAVDNLMAQVANKKCVRAEKKTKLQEEQEVEEAHPKAKKETMNTHTITATISPLADKETHNANYDPGLEDLHLNNALFAMTFAELIVHCKETYSQSYKDAELYATNIEEQKQAIENIQQQALHLDTKEAEEHLVLCTHGWVKK
jgi:hypothetical protein